MNERGTLDTDTVRNKMAELGVIPIKADYTRKNALITEWLQRFEKAGVPMYVLIPADPDKELWTLPEVLTPGMVVDALQQAAAGSSAGPTGKR